jgi:hypothetical protein
MDLIEFPSLWMRIGVTGVGAPATISYLRTGMFSVPFQLPLLPAGAPLDIRVQMINQDGSPIPWATASFTLPMPDCSNVGGTPVHSASVVCNMDEDPALSTMGVVQIQTGGLNVNFEQIDVNGTPITNLAASPGTSARGLLPSGFPSGPATVHVVALSVDGATRYEWNDPVTVPTCFVNARFWPTATCDGHGTYSVDYDITPTDLAIVGFESPPGTPVSCSRTAPGHYRCINVTAVLSPDGQEAYLPFVINFAPGTRVGDMITPGIAQTASATPCPGGPSTGLWNLTVACDAERPGNVVASVEVPSSYLAALDDEHTATLYSYYEPDRTNHPIAIGTLHHPFRQNYSIPTSAAEPLVSCIQSVGGSETCHTFSNLAALIAAANCEGSTDADQWSFAIRCSEFDLTRDPYMYIANVSYPGSIPRGDYSLSVGGATIGGSMGEGSTCSFMIPLDFRLSGNVEVRIRTGDASYTHPFGDISGYPLPSCGNASTSGWRLERAYCTEEGQAAAYITYPSSLTLESINASVGSLRFNCADFRTGSPYHLVCLGPVSASPAALQITYTSGGASQTVSFPDWPGRAPTFCPTPEPGGQQPPVIHCSAYNGNASACTANGCYYWVNTTCNAGPDPCSAYNGNAAACSAVITCKWVDPTCWSP